MATGSLQLSDLIRKLDSLTASPRESPFLPSAPRDVFITPCEVHGGHGTGILLQRVFGAERDLISIRSLDQFGGEQDFGTGVRISHGPASPAAIRARVAAEFAGISVRRILCVPFLPDDVATAIALHEISGAPVCTWLMDDQNIAARGIEDAAMRELLQRSSLRLAISPEMRAAYQKKFGLPFFYAPPLAPAGKLPAELQIPVAAGLKDGVLIGNLWSPRWPKLLRDTVRGSGVRLSYPGGTALGIPAGKLRADGIFPEDRLPEDDLIALLRSKSFAVLTSGTMGESEDRRWMAEFSLPSRLIYMMATAHIPAIVLGSRDSAASHFVEQFGLGLTAGYDRDAFVRAVGQITQPETNLAMRRRAFAVASRFSDLGAGDWIWRSLALGRPADARFEDLLPRA